MDDISCTEYTTMEPPTEAAHCLVQPKDEVADDPGITYGCEDMEAVTVKEEWCDIGLEQDGGVSGEDGGVSKQDGGMKEQDVGMVMPIKTELTLSDDLAQLHTQHQLAELGSVPQVLKVEWEPKAEEEEAADCASTSVAPLFMKLTTKRGNKVKAEDVDTDQKSEQVLDIYNGQPYFCKLCNYRCASKRDLTKHKKSHTGDKPFSCELCGYRFASKYNLVNHVKTHTGEKPFCCELCNYRCAQKSYLVIHMRTHTGEKPYVCELCDYRFTRKSHLVSHMRSHTGDKPFPCDLCDYRSSRKSDLVIHMRSHSGEKPYFCELCNFTCTQKFSLLRHMRTHTW